MFEKPLPEWLAQGVKPPQEIINDGYTPGYKPPAEWENWLRYTAYEALKENREQFNAHQGDYMPHDSELNQYASGVDGNGIYTVIDYERPDGTLYLKSTASNPNSNGYYQTVTWDFYESDGATVALTKTWTISYDADGVPTSKEVA